MFLVGQLPPPIIALAFALSLWAGLQVLWSYTYGKSPLRHLKGPKGTSFFLGNLNEIITYNSEMLENWVKEYGHTLRFKGLFNRDQLFTVDTRAINHILTHSNDFQKPSTTRRTLSEIFGEGLLVVEGTQHRQQRRIMNPAFGPAQIRALTDTFFTKAFLLCDLWSSEVTKDPSATIAGARIDVFHWLNRVTLDNIGLAGFNYNFNSLDSNGQPSELSEAFSIMFETSQNLTIVDIVLRSLVPILRLIPSVEIRKLRAAHRTMTQIGSQLLANAKAAAMASGAAKGEIEKNDLRGRDLLSLLVKANMSTDIPESQRLSDKDVIAQVPTFLVEGHETTSIAVAWALYALTRAPDNQMKLRDELLSVDTETPSMDELMALPYLDAVVRETLRLHAPVPFTRRVAMRDDVLPVEKPYVDRYGEACDTIAVTKNDEVIIPILAVNRSEELWGPDAHQFKPERWNDIPKSVSRVPGVWGHMLTFIGGPRACIGYRFSIVEIKVILFSLVRMFEFELAVPASEVCSRTAVMQRPVLRSDPTHQPQLPMLIKPYQKA